MFNSSLSGLFIEPFSKKYKLSYVFGNSLLFDNKLSPSSGTAIALSKKKALIKAHNEFYERYSLGLKYDKIVNVYDYINKKSIYDELNNYKYGFNKKYGYIDTIGTATGYESSKILKKAIEELIANNESLLFWYFNMGNAVLKSEFIYEIIKYYELETKDLFIFRNSNLSNFPVYFSLLFDNSGKYLSSGIGISNSETKSLEKSIQECRILETENQLNKNSFINRLNLEESKIFYDYTKCKYESLKKLEFKEKSYSQDIEIVPWITNMNVCLIYGRDNLKVVKCCSKQLYNCLPKKKNLTYEKARDIINRYGSINNIKRSLEYIFL